MSHKKLEAAVSAVLLEDVRSGVEILPGGKYFPDGVGGGPAEIIAEPCFLAITPTQGVLYSIKHSLWGGDELVRLLASFPRSQTRLVYVLRKDDHEHIDLSLNDKRVWMLQAPLPPRSDPEATCRALSRELASEVAASQQAFAENNTPLAIGRRVLENLPPPIPGAVAVWRKVFESTYKPDEDDEIVEVKGIVTNTYELESGHMGGGDNIAAFDMINDAGTTITNWVDSFQASAGQRLVIHAVAGPGWWSDHDHIDDEITAIWVIAYTLEE